MGLIFLLGKCLLISPSVKSRSLEERSCPCAILTNRLPVGDAAIYTKFARALLEVCQLQYDLDLKTEIHRKTENNGLLKYICHVYRSKNLYN